MDESRTIIVCNWHDCPFVAGVTARFAERNGLTRREHEVLELVVDGLSIEEIAGRLVVSKGTVKAHLHRIYQKCGVSGRNALMRVYAVFGRQ